MNKKKLPNTYANAIHTEGNLMAHIYNRNGSFTVVIDGIVVGHNLTQQEALKRLDEWDFG